MAKLMQELKSPSRTPEVEFTETVSIYTSPCLLHSHSTYSHLTARLRIVERQLGMRVVLREISTQLKMICLKQERLHLLCLSKMFTKYVWTSS